MVGRSIVRLLTVVDFRLATSPHMKKPSICIVSFHTYSDWKWEWTVIFTSTVNWISAWWQTPEDAVRNAPFFCFPALFSFFFCSPFLLTTPSTKPLHDTLPSTLSVFGFWIIPKWYHYPSSIHQTCNMIWVLESRLFADYKSQWDITLVRKLCICAMYKWPIIDLGRSDITP